MSFYFSSPSFLSCWAAVLSQVIVLTWYHECWATSFSCPLCRGQPESVGVCATLCGIIDQSTCLDIFRPTTVFSNKNHDCQSPLPSWCLPYSHWYREDLCPGWGGNHNQIGSQFSFGMYFAFCWDYHSGTMVWSHGVDWSVPCGFAREGCCSDPKRYPGWYQNRQEPKAAGQDWCCGAEDQEFINWKIYYSCSKCNANMYCRTQREKIMMPLFLSLWGVYVSRTLTWPTRDCSLAVSHSLAALRLQLAE